MSLTNSFLLPGPGPGPGPKAQAALSGNSAEQQPRMHLNCIHVRNRYMTCCCLTLAEMNCSSYFPTRRKETLGSWEGGKGEHHLRVLPLVPAEATVSLRPFCQALM